MKSIEKKYYKISEVAEILDINASTLRFWESKFTVIKPKRNQHGSRFYTPNDIEKIRMVYYLVKEKGMKLDAAQQQILHNRDGLSKRLEAIERLKSIRDRLKAMLDSTSRRKADPA